MPHSTLAANGVRVLLGLAMCATATVAFAAEVETAATPAACWPSDVWTPSIDWTPEQREVLDVMRNGPVGISEPSAFEAWSAGYAEDWSVWTVGSPRTRTKAPHMELVRDYVIGQGAKVPHFRLNPVAVDIRGDFAVVRSYDEEYIVEADGEIRDLHFAAVTILERDDGRWRLVSSNVFHMPRPDWATPGMEAE